MKPTTVYRIGPATQEDYPRLMANHPRNRGIDWVQVANYAEHGSAADGCRFDIFVKADREFDAVWIAGRTGFLVSPRLREVLQSVAGNQVEFLPVAVNGQPYSVLRVLPVIDALDLDRSDVRYDVGTDKIKGIDLPVWRRDRLTDPLMFRIPQLRPQLWATDSVRRAYDDSGCTGLSFWQPGDVV